MTESCSNSKLERIECNVEDLKKDLCSEFNVKGLPGPQDSGLGEKGHLQVYLRIRPFTATESDNGEAQDCVTIEPPDMVLLKPSTSSLSARLSDKSALQTGQRFQFSQVYGPGTSQRELFEGTVKSLVKGVLDGENSLVFTYGVTNAGKTFTFLGPDADVGILPRSLNVIFSSIAERAYTQMSIKPQRCREFIRLTKDQQAEEAIGKRNLFRQLKESDTQRSTNPQLSSTSKTTLEGSDVLEMEGMTEDRFSLEVDTHTKFSVWVSFCEIYNENIHDLLEPIPSGALKRTTLRLSQDIKGNSFVKDLRWIPVENAEEAYRVVKLGRKNQSFSSTRLNQLSSRSHSIFSIRILRIEDVGIPRVHSVSELCLCDLAGSERCAKTQNKGDRLKEAGNINTSMLILGKCINALRHNQQSKLLQHVPFRESKLTHYLQGFLCGRGKACMIVNINQCASMHDETLNVLKFSAVAQKVVVLTTRTLPSITHKSAQELSFIINTADKKVLLGRRKSSLTGWESSLEDVLEDDDDEYEEESMMGETVQESGDEDIDSDGDKVVMGKDTYERQVALLERLQEQLKRERAESMVLEARVREEVTKDFSELFSEMQNDYNERLVKEKEIIEERAERRLEIFKDLVSKNTTATHKEQDMDKSLDLDSIMESMSSDLVGIRNDVETAHSCLIVTRSGDPAGKHRAASDLERKVSELAEQLKETQELLAQKAAELDNLTCQQSNKQLEETKKSLESQELKFSELMEICLEKDEMISKLQTALNKQVEDATRDKATVDSIRAEILRLKNNCTCCRGTALRSHSTHAEARKRQGEPQPDLEGQPPRKKDFFAEEGGEEGEMRSLRFQLDEKSSEVARLELTVAALQRELEVSSQGYSRLQEQLRGLEKSSREDGAEAQQQRVHELTLALEEAAHTREEALSTLREEQRAHQETLAALGDERRAREEALAALEYQTMGKEEALASLEDERKAREETLAALGEQKRIKEEVVASLAEESRAKEEAKQRREEALGSLEEERRAKAEALSALEEERKRGLEEDREKREQNTDTLRQEAQELAGKLEVMEKQVAEQTARAEQASGDVQAAQTKLEKHTNEIQEKTAQIHSLTQEVQGLKQEVQSLKETSETTSYGAERDGYLLREEVSVLRKDLSEAQVEKERREKQIEKLEQELGQVKEQLSQKQLALDQQMEQLTEKLRQQELVSNRQQEELREKLQEQSQQPIEELKEQLKNQELALEQEVEQLKATLEEQKQTSHKQVEELKHKLREQELSSEKQSEEFKRKLTEQQLTSDQQLELLQQKLSQQEQTSDQLMIEVEEVRAKAQSAAIVNTTSSEAEDNLRSLNSDLQAEVVTLRAKVTHIEEERVQTLETEKEAKAVSAHDQLTFADRAAELERLLKEKEDEMERKLAQTDGELEKMKAERETNLAEKEGDLQKRLAEKEALVLSLERSLREAQERREEEECQAVQEARRREVERRRELLAVAEEAIAQKDAELEKRAQEINSLKENARQDSDKVKSISLDLQRKEDDVSDLKEKLADSKKQIQQVQKEISSMREEERNVKQKLADLDKAKKQLQSDLAIRDRTIQQLKTEQSSDSKSAETLQLYQKVCKDLEAKEHVMEDMRAALTEQEETQEQMEQVLEEKLDLVQELTDEVEKLKGLLQDRDSGKDTPSQRESHSDDLRLAKQEAAKAQESLKLCMEKHQADRRKWLEEKMSLIGHAKEAEDKRNQEMRKFADNRERHAKQQSQMESLSAQLCEKEQAMERWRHERDTLVAALEVQLQKLISSNADKDKLIQQLRCSSTSQPPLESGGATRLEALQVALSERDSEILSLKEASAAKANGAKHSETATQTKADEPPAEVGGKPQGEASNLKSRGWKDARGSASSQGSSGFPSVLESSEISTENGRTSRFPKPELEISFSPLHPNRLAMRRQGEDTTVTVKINRPARKRKSSDMDMNKSFRSRKAKHRATREDEVEAENRRNTRTKLTPKLAPHQEEGSSPAGGQDSNSGTRSRKEGTLQKIGDFLQSSPTLLGYKAKKMMSFVSGRGEGDSEGGSSSLTRKAKRSKKKLYRPDISSPIDMPSHPIISREPEEKESDHMIIKRRLRTRTAK